MTIARRSFAVLVATLSLAAAGCQTDDAAKRDAKDAAHDVKKAGKKAANDTEKAIPGDGDDDGK